MTFSGIGIGRALCLSARRSRAATCDATWRYDTFLLSRLSCRAAMDLLEYQGKQLFARHGIPVPSGKPAATVADAVAAADEIGYPCVVKAQVLIGGRGKAGGIKVAKDRAEAQQHAEAILGMDIRGFTVHEVWIEARLRHRRRVLRLDRLRPLGEGPARDALDTGRHGHRGGRREDAGGARETARRPAARLPGLPRPAARLRSRRRRGRRSGPSARLLAKLYAAFVAEEAMLVEVNPLIVTGGPQGRRARREGHARRQRALPASRQRGAAQPLPGGRAGADGARARAHVREARRRHRHPRQRRRARDVDARRRRAGRRRARELPRRRRRLEGRRDRQRGRGDPLRREGQSRAVQHLRRHHPLRRGRQGPDRGVRRRQADGPVRRAPRRHERRRGPQAARRRRACRTSTPRRR